MKLSQSNITMLALKMPESLKLEDGCCFETKVALVSIVLTHIAAQVIDTWIAKSCSYEGCLKFNFPDKPS